MAKKKLLVFASTFPRWKNDTNPGFVYELSKRLTDDFDVSVLTPNYPGAKKDEVMDKMKVHRFRYFFRKYEKLAGSGGILPTLKKNKWYYFTVPFFMLGEFFALRKQVKENRPDVIHAHWIIPQGFVCALIKKLYNVEYVVTSHGSDIMGLSGSTWMKRFALKNAKKVTVVSTALKEKVLKEIEPNLKIEVIPMGIDTNLFNPKAKDNSIKKKYKIDGPFLLFVGRLAPEKGVQYLIEAMPKVIEKHPKAKLMIIGDGTLKDELKSKVMELGISENVILMGWVDNKKLPKYYATADVFVSPSLREGFGLTFAEAGLCGCWLIGTNVGGIKEIIKDGKNGFFVKVQSKDIADKILRSIGKKGNKKLLELFGWKNTSKKYAEIFE